MRNLQEGIDRLVAMYIEPVGVPELKWYKYENDKLLNVVRVYIYVDDNGIWFAKQADDNFMLPFDAYRKEVLGDRVDCNHLLKTPKEVTQYFMSPAKEEICNTLSMYKR